MSLLAHEEGSHSVASLIKGNYESKLGPMLEKRKDVTLKRDTEATHRSPMPWQKRELF